MDFKCWNPRSSTQQMFSFGSEKHKWTFSSIFKSEAQFISTLFPQSIERRPQIPPTNISYAHKYLCHPTSLNNKGQADIVGRVFLCFPLCLMLWREYLLFSPMWLIRFLLKKTLNETGLSISVFKMNYEMSHKIQYRSKFFRLSILFNPKTSHKFFLLKHQTCTTSLFKWYRHTQHH